ncbi:MAG: ATP-binding protein [Myxococcota bacterium]|nr:ATP-binding protein [Myxococcota bacterium]
MPRRPDGEHDEGSEAESPPRPAPSDVVPSASRDPIIGPPTPEAWRNAWPVEEGSGERAQTMMLEAPAPERVPALLLRLSRDVGIDMHDDQIVQAFVEAMRDLFRARRFAVRLLASEGEALALFYASGRVRSGMRDPLLLERKAADRHAISQAELDRLGVGLVDAYLPFFEEGALGFDVPVTDGGRMLGILSVEYPAGFEVPAWDAPILVPLTLELASKLRSARLLRESNYLRDYLAQVIERANAPIVVLRTDRRIENVNLAMMTVTGGERDRWLGRDFLELLPAGEQARALAALEAARRGEASTGVELRLPRASGGFARIAFNTASILASDGEVAGVVAIGRDLTEVRDLEEQIIHAEKLATLGQLAAGVVHELNNPLTSISVYSEYLLTKGKRDGVPPGDLEKLGRIAEAAARMLRFTRDLVTYARPSSEEPGSLSLGEVVDQALVFCDHVINDAHVVVQRCYAGELPPLWGVRGQLHQVFINLVTNACHAIAGSGGASGTLKVSIDHDGDGLVVRVCDDGPGIASEHVAHIFEPFFSTKGEGRGTGLGLSIVRNIVQQHGGTIDVSSRTDETERTGTEFEVRFPLRSLGLPASPTR